MLSIGSGTTAGAAQDYYHAKDPMFETEKNGQWFGKGAEKLELQGHIKQVDFEAVLRGIAPQTGEQLVAGKIERNKETGELEDKHRAGNDLTFSAPKSVSVAFAAGVDGIKEAHDSAVKSVLEHIQEHYSHVRTPDGKETTGNIIAGIYDHSTSRAYDPQLHSHAFLLNISQAQDGSWKANEPRAIFQDQKALGELYRTQLAKELQAQGHEINWTDREALTFEIKGVSSELVDHFSQRREAIEEQVKSWKEEGKHAGVKDSKLYEMAALGTRSPKDKSLTKEDVQTIWKEGFEQSGTTIEAVKSTLETSMAATKEANIERNNQEFLGQAQSTKQSATEVAAEAVRILTSTEAVVDRAKILQVSNQISGGQHDARDLSKAIDKVAIKHGQTEQGRELYTTKEVKELEQRNIENLKSLDSFKSVTTKEEVSQYIDRWEEKAGFKLSAGQRDMVVSELAGEKGFAVVQGDPGTGKTTASKVVEDFGKDVLKDSGREHYTINIAYTGKAASEMSEASGKAAFTIDSFLNAYSSGKVLVQPPERVEAHKQAQISREERNITEATRHSAEQVNRVSGLHEQLPNVAAMGRGARHKGLKAEINEIKSGHVIAGIGSKWNNDPITPGRHSISISNKGLALHYEHTSRTGLLNTDVTNVQKTRGSDGSKAAVKSTRTGDLFSHRESSKGKYTDSRGNEMTFSSKSFGSKLMGYQKTVKEERSSDLVKRTTTKTYGKKVSGTTETIHRDGRVSTTKWEGYKGLFNSGLTITSSSTRTRYDEQAALKEFSSTFVRTMVNAEKTYNLAKQDVSAVVSKIATFFGAEKPKVVVPEVSLHKQNEINNVATPQQTALQTSSGKPKIVIPKGAQVVLKIDEASFVGAKQAEHLLNVVKDLQGQGIQTKIALVGDTKQMQSIAAGDFFRQAQNVAKQGHGDAVELKDINRQKDGKDGDLLKTATDLNRDGDKKGLAENAIEAIKALQAQGRITEVKGDKEALLRASAVKYIEQSNMLSSNQNKAAAGEKRNTMMVTGLNKDRTELNNIVREMRVERGEIQEGKSYTVSAPARTSVSADSYKIGQSVKFTGERDSGGKMQAWGTEMIGTEGRIVATDSNKNTVRVSYETQRDNGKFEAITKDFRASEMHGRVQVSDEKQLKISAGDRLVALQNDNKVGLKNGQQMTVKEIDEQGKAVVQVDGKDKPQSLDLNNYNKVDHAYCVTTEKSQGATVESVIVVAPSCAIRFFWTVNPVLTGQQIRKQLDT